ncbi:MAG: UDP-N-acetylmuramate--L-alanine ligase [Planctomycetes bacterium]|nr:UDP-N-acetylmuramate--L-alanine ligase [Planctomycetota bacterium]
MAPWRRGQAAVIPGAHLIGTGGAGMTALAEILVGRGWRVSGSDETQAPLSDCLFKHRRFRFFHGHRSEHVPADATVVVHSPAVPADNVERMAAARHGLDQASYPQMLGRLMEGQLGMCIAGTHGKSSTTAMAATILDAAGIDPTVAVGAQIVDWRCSGRAGSGDWFVVESCEYQRSFLHLRPTAVAILGIEPDHFDCYRDLPELILAFRQFAQLVPPSGVVVARGDCAATAAAVEGIEAPVQTFSRKRGADWWAADLRPLKGCYRFRVFHRQEFHCEIALSVPGRHQVLNALAAVALADYAGIRASAIREGLEAYRGLRRRFEVAGSWRGATLVDDYAHHPTEVRAGLRTARQVFGRRRLWCVFQPHQASRTAALREAFARSFRRADRVIISDIYRAREKPGPLPGPTAADLAGDVARHGVTVIPVHRLDAIARVLKEQLQPGDVLITMGAGDVGTLYDAFFERLPGHRHAG